MQKRQLINWSKIKTIKSKNYKKLIVKNFWRITNLIILGFLIAICFAGTFYKHISFGWGLGDMFGYMMLYGVTIIHLLLTITFRNKRNLGYEYLTIIFLVITIYISLKATIWRGGEYSWNGSIFYLPCPTKIIIENEKEEKELLVRMCTMEYYSDLTAIWNGQEMKDLKGEIKIPDQLKKYIDYPIKSIFIQSDYNNRVDNGDIKKVYNFELDTLKVNNEYKLSGEIIKIVNSKPVFIMRIKK